MIIFPAIDLRRGLCVRLRQGDPGAETVFGADPAAMAQHWADQGATWLHVVNLDGALGDQSRDAPNLKRLREICETVALPIQFGGGLRTLDGMASILAMGATRVVLGTLAVQRPEMVAEAIERFGAARVVVALDARGGQVATHGWRETSALEIGTVARTMKRLGVERIVHTDVARDGMLSGVNAEAGARLAQTSGLKVIASGGVRDLEDIRRLLSYRAQGIEGVIVGQALYAGHLKLRQAMELVERVSSVDADGPSLAGSGS